MNRVISLLNLGRKTEKTKTVGKHIYLNKFANSAVSLVKGLHKNLNVLDEIIVLLKEYRVFCFVHQFSALVS